MALIRPFSQRVGISGWSLPSPVYSRYVRSLRRKTALGEKRQSLDFFNGQLVRGSITNPVVIGQL